MTRTHTRLSAVLAAAALAALLSACGGGGSDAPSSASAPTQTPSTSAPTQPVMDVPAPTYAPDSQEYAAYTLLNEERARCGFGRLAQSPQLDLAAKMHGLYLQANFPDAPTHTEVATKPAFYAESPSDRAKKAGYQGGAGEAISPERSGVLAVRKLLAVPYHETGILQSVVLDVGLAFTPFGTGWWSLVVDLGQPSNKPAPMVTDVRTYPCDGTVGTSFNVGGENPSPFPTEAGAVWGQPVVVHGDVTLRVTSASIAGPTGPVGIKAIYGDGQITDPNGYFKSGSAAIIPVPLAPATIYTVTVNGTNKGQPFTKTFRFQTAAG